MLKRKLSVKTLNEKCKALKDIEKGLSNKDAFKKYGVPPNKVSTWIENKEKYFKALKEKLFQQKTKIKRKWLWKTWQCCVSMVPIKTESKHSNGW